MKHFTLFLLCCACALSAIAQEPVYKATQATLNESYTGHVFLYALPEGWLPLSEIMGSNAQALHNKLAVLLESKGLTSISGMNDDQLSWLALAYYFLRYKLNYSDAELQNFTSENDYRNTIISWSDPVNGRQTAYSVSQMQGFGLNKILNIACGWQQKEDVDFQSKKETLQDIKGHNPQFDCKDTQGYQMDVAHICYVNKPNYKYLALYHKQLDNVFTLFLAGSNNLRQWTRITELGNHSHQGDIRAWGDGFIVANEQDKSTPNSIRVRYYSSYENLCSNTAANDITLPVQFSLCSNGTPEIRRIEGDSPSNSHILIGFHYYANCTRDQLATGILYNFNAQTGWRAWENHIANYNIREMGYQGNIGGRQMFQHNGNNYVLQEAQITRNDWASWRIVLGDGAFYTTLQYDTPKGSASFANPSIAPVADGTGNKFLAGLYMPTEGNQEGERGEAMYLVDFEAATTSLPSTGTDDSGIVINCHGNLLHIGNADGCPLTVYDLQGRPLYKGICTSNSMTVDIGNEETMLLVQLLKDGKSTVRKTFRLRMTK